MKKVEYKIRKAKKEDLQYIRKLQLKYHYKNVSEKEKKQHGFVSVETSINLLHKISMEDGILVAETDSKIVGYEIPLNLKNAAKIPLLDPLVRISSDLIYKNKKIKDYKFLIAGQILIDKEYKGHGIAKALHKNTIKILRKKYEILISEVSTQNPRSLHVSITKLGFKILKQYKEKGRSWYIIMQDIRN